MLDVLILLSKLGLATTRDSSFELFDLLASFSKSLPVVNKRKSTTSPSKFEPLWELIAANGILFSSASGEINIVLLSSINLSNGLITKFPTSFHNSCASLRNCSDAIRAFWILFSISSASPRSIASISPLLLSVRAKYLSLPHFSSSIFEPLYGEYPYKNLPIDSDSARLNWIYTRVDNGEYFFRNIVKGIVDKFNFEPLQLIEKIQEKRTKLSNDLYMLESEVETLKRNIVNECNQFPENRNVK